MTQPQYQQQSLTVKCKKIKHYNIIQDERNKKQHIWNKILNIHFLQSLLIRIGLATKPPLNSLCLFVLLIGGLPSCSSSGVYVHDGER